MGQWRDRLLFVGKRNGSLAHPLQTVIVDVGGDGAVGPQHDTGLAAVFQDAESGFFHFFPGAGVDNAVLLKSAEYRLAAKEFLPFGQRNSFGVHGPVIGGRLKAGEEIQVVGPAGKTADMQQVHGGKLIGGGQHRLVPGSDVRKIDVVREEAALVVDTEIDAVHPALGEQQLIQLDDAFAQGFDAGICPAAVLSNSL